jgi:hypothetical protein
MPESKGRERLAVPVCLGVGVLVGLVMLYPIGGSFRTVSDPFELILQADSGRGKYEDPGKPKEAVLFYWSLGSILFLDRMTGGALKFLTPGTILVGLALSVLAGALSYWLVIRIGRGGI